jgi:hypothetical protein
VILDQTKRTLEIYASGLRLVRADKAAEAVEAIATLLGEFYDVSMASFVARGATGAGPVHVAAKQCEISLATQQIDVVAQLLAAGGAKRDLVKDLKDLASLLRSHCESETLAAVLNKLRRAMQPDPIELQVSSYIERLRRETGTPAFERTLAELTASSLKKEHVVAIAKSVYGGIKNSTSRIKALAFIRKPHDAYVSTKRGIEANGGRSAA